MYEVILKRFEHPDEVRTFEKGKFELVSIGGTTIGRATYEPGWKWSLHVGKASGAKSCVVEHLGMVISGRATAAMDDGRIVEMKAGDVFMLLPATIVGSWGMNLTFLCISLEPVSTPGQSEATLVVVGAGNYPPCTTARTANPLCYTKNVNSLAGQIRERRLLDIMIHLTPVAASKVKEIMNMQNPIPTALRVAVVGGGCSGFQYHMAFENQTSDSDEIMDFDGLKVAVDQMSSMYLDGVEIDYIETLEGAGFKFNNPNVKSTCGCGSSFSV